METPGVPQEKYMGTLDRELLNSVRRPFKHKEFILPSAKEMWQETFLSG